MSDISISHTIIWGLSPMPRIKKIFLMQDKEDLRGRILGILGSTVGGGRVVHGHNAYKIVDHLSKSPFVGIPEAYRARVLCFNKLICTRLTEQEFDPACRRYMCAATYSRYSVLHSRRSMATLPGDIYRLLANARGYITKWTT